MNIGLIAHDTKKELMINFCIAYKNILSGHNLFATGSTGQLLRDNVELDVYMFLPGHLGGGRQMCSQVECNQMDAVIYLRDPVHVVGNEIDAEKLFRACDLNNIPLATNLASAELLVLAIGRGDLDWRNAYK